MIYWLLTKTPILMYRDKFVYHWVFLEGIFKRIKSSVISVAKWHGTCPVIISLFTISSNNLFPHVVNDYLSSNKSFISINIFEKNCLCRNDTRWKIQISGLTFRIHRSQCKRVQRKTKQSTGAKKWICALTLRVALRLC